MMDISLLYAGKILLLMISVFQASFCLKKIFDDDIAGAIIPALGFACAVAPLITWTN